MGEERLLFSDIKFVIGQSNNVDEIKTLLIGNGAHHINYLSEHVTLVVADITCPEAEEAVELYDKPVVRSLWAHLSLKAKKLLPMGAFSPIKSIFQNVVASISHDFSPNDVEILVAALTFHGANVTKDYEKSTHLIVPSSDCSSPSNLSSKLCKIVAPDWVLDSIKQNKSCDELLYEPALLLPPPPPTPPPPPPPKLPEPSPLKVSNERPPAETEKTKQETKPSSSSESYELETKIGNSHQEAQPNSSQSQPIRPQAQVKPAQAPLLPRLQMPTNVIGSAKPKFRPILPPNNNVSLAQRQQVQNDRAAATDMQKKVTINYSQQRKPGPYTNNLDLQQPTQANMQQQPYVQQHQPNIQISPGSIMQQSRLPQPQMYQQQIRGAYSSNQAQPRGDIQSHLMNQTPHQPMAQLQQPGQVMNRFQDPNSQANQRPYQVCLQPQTNSNYQQGAMHRQPVYYNQDSNQVAVRGPLQAPVRLIQNEQLTYDNFNSVQHPDDSLVPHQRINHYQSSQPHIVHSQPRQQLQSPQQHYPHGHPPQNPQALQHQASMISNRPQFQPNYPATVVNNQLIRNSRDQFYPPEHQGARMPRPMQGPLIRSSRIPELNLPQQQIRPPSYDQTNSFSSAPSKARTVENIEYFGFDPKENVPKSAPLSGCKFKFVEYEDVIPKQKDKWCIAIRDAGGSFTDDLNDATLLICETRSSPTYSEALKLKVRCVTIYWVNDVIARGHLSYPWKALHLPSSFSKDEKPLKDHIISLTNIRGRERKEVKEMIHRTGAKYTEYFSNSNTLLICGHVGGEKFERAVDWKIPVSNCRILSDILLDSSRSLGELLAQPAYQLFNLNDPLKINSYSNIRQVMSPWLKPLKPASKNELEKTIHQNGTSKEIATIVNSNDDSGNATGGSDLDANMATTNMKNVTYERVPRKSSGPVRILFTHLDAALTKQLESYALKLGLGFATSPTNCTHLVVDRISRTPKFICAFSHANHIVNYNWILESNAANQVLDESAFHVHDDVGEEKFSLNLAFSLVKRKRRGKPLFENFVFFVTPSVCLDLPSFIDMIESAGGSVATKKLPSKLQLKQIKLDGKRFVVVTCQDDLHLCSAFEQKSTDIVGPEFVISGILRQDIDFEAHRLAPDQFEALSPPKKLRGP